MGKCPAVICTDCQIVWQKPQLRPFGEKKCMIQPMGCSQKGLQWMREARGRLGVRREGPGVLQATELWRAGQRREEASKELARAPGMPSRR